MSDSVVQKINGKIMSDSVVQKIIYLVSQYIVLCTVK